MKSSFLASFSLLLFLPALAAATPAIRIGHPHSFPTPAPGVPGVGFLTLSNETKQADRLLAVESPAAGRIEIHQNQIKDGVMRMRALPEGLALPAQQSVALAPGGAHLMLFSLKEPLKLGQRLPLTLRFERAGIVATELVVESRERPASEAPADEHAHH